MSVRAAFTCIYCFFEEHLTEQDKSLLYFGPVFMEHILYKIPRWKAHLTDEDVGGRLEDLTAMEIEKNHLWIPGENFMTNLAFPTPLTISSTWLEQTIELFSSSISTT